MVEICRCLSDETRLRIIHLLAQGPLCVCHLQWLLDLPQVAVSKHLAYLREHRVVEARRFGQWVIYSLPAKRSRALTLQLQCLQAWGRTEEVLRADRQRLEQLRPRCDWVEEALEAGWRTPQSGKVVCKPSVCPEA